jgi:hypothetical protein
MEGLPRPPALEFVDDEGVARGGIILYARKEPIIWATTQYVYVFGPLRRFGDFLVPDWPNTTYALALTERVPPTGTEAPPDLPLFQAPQQR